MDIEEVDIEVSLGIVPVFIPLTPALSYCRKHNEIDLQAWAAHGEPLLSRAEGAAVQDRL